MFLGSTSATEMSLFSLPTKYDGLGVRNPVDSAPLLYTASVEAMVDPFYQCLPYVTAVVNCLL